MCGIAGFAGDVGDRDPEAHARLRGMCAAIRHRGPDDEGTHVEAGIALGMRRLSIIDLTTGHQPIGNEDGTIWVVFNGEIYNYRALRAELEAYGHRFRTSSDTETIVHAYEQWGDQAFTRLRGMFGIALWDRREGSLRLARDRVGIKPLYYSVSDATLIFGSELKAILAGLTSPPAIDLAALDHYLSFFYTPGDASIFTGIHKLPPGHVLRWHGGTTRVHRYWELPAEERHPRSAGDAIDALDATLRDAVQSHLMSDVPLGAFLSGGVDSSLVVGLMAEASPRPVKTFSIGFDDPRYDELEHARLVARHFDTDHHEFVVRPDALAILDDLIAHFDEPFGDTSAIPTWYVSELARRHVTVVLSGDGGDELFGGYDRYFPHPRVATFDRWAPPGTRALADLVWPRLPHGVRGKNFLRHVARDARGRYVEEVTHFRPDERQALFSADVRRRVQPGAAEAGLASRFTRFAGLPWHAQLMHVDFETYLPEDILTKVDRMSMAHSIESRVPLLDNEVVELAARLPAHLKIHNGRRKHILKETAARLLPPEILTRRKQGFAVPMETWFRGRLRHLFTEVLLAPRTRQRGYFDARFVDRLVREQLEEQRDHTEKLWALLVFELWHRAYIDSRPSATAGEPALAAAGAS